MAEVQERSSRSGRKRKSPRVDMTAMVDVAFLLLTFFVLTTTLAKPPAIPIVKPFDDGNPKPVDMEKILTLILGSEDRILYYEGMPDQDLTETDFSEQGLRQVIFNHLNKNPNPCGEEKEEGCWDPIFVLKPNKDCRYKNVVDAVDELRLTGASKFVFTEMTPADSLLLLDNRY